MARKARLFIRFSFARSAYVNDKSGDSGPAYQPVDIFLLHHDCRHGLPPTIDCTTKTALVGAVFFIILALSHLGAAKEVVSLASSGHETHQKRST